MLHHLALLLANGNALVFTCVQIIGADEIGISDQIRLVVKGVASESQKKKKTWNVFETVDYLVPKLDFSVKLSKSLTEHTVYIYLRTRTIKFFFATQL